MKTNNKKLISRLAMTLMVIAAGTACKRSWLEPKPLSIYTPYWHI